MAWGRSSWTNSGGRPPVRHFLDRLYRGRGALPLGGPWDLSMKAYSPILLFVLQVSPSSAVVALLSRVITSAVVTRC